jgi:long-chain acyl-CoA synthetase
LFWLRCNQALVPGIDLRVEDETGKEVEVGQRGELVARGANVMGAYWNNPQDTALVFRNGMFRTGDIGYRDSDGYFYILDRLKDMIVTGGENVYSGEVQDASNLLYIFPLCNLLQHLPFPNAPTS